MRISNKAYIPVRSSKGKRNPARKFPMRFSLIPPILDHIKTKPKSVQGFFSSIKIYEKPFRSKSKFSGKKIWNFELTPRKVQVV